MNAVTIFISSGLLEVFELTVARALDLIKEGDDVTMLYCDGSIYAGCTANPFGWLSVCRSCNSVYKKAFANLPSSVKVEPITLYYPVSQMEALTAWSLAEEEVLNGVASTLLTNYRVNEQTIGSNLLLRRISKRYFLYSKLIFQCAIAYFQRASVYRLEFYNGRLVPTRALLAAAKLSAKEFSVLESWGVNRSMRVYPNATPHEFKYNKHMLEKFLVISDYDEKLGIRFFIDRSKGLPTNDRSYATHQTGTLQQVDLSRPVLSFFLSSPDELKVSGGEFFTAWSIEPERFIAEVYGLLRDQFNFVVRMHPNQHGDKTGETERIYCTLASLTGIRVIKPLDRTSSYELILNSDYVITFGSTIGIEATYWEKVSILVGRALWEKADVVYKCEDPLDVVVLLKSNPRPLSRENAVRIGHYFMADIDRSYYLSASRLGFHVGGQNFLRFKRKGLGNILNKILEKLLRMHLLTKFNVV